ncbi:hypothetical protein [Paenibacillus pinistramenti]|uniref:hypothetical protein n=1 Tax=Paenibacillus pinistramenti TaxID=1768003 RepID=UPI001109C0C1|nr:hypothetical protein [Paenibacillus pinistramenti]
MENSDERFRPGTASGGNEQEWKEDTRKAPAADRLQDNNTSTNTSISSGSPAGQSSPAELREPSRSDGHSSPADSAAQEFHPLQNIHKQLRENPAAGELTPSEEFHTEEFHTEEFHTEEFHTEEFHTEEFHTGQARSEQSRSDLSRPEQAPSEPIHAELIPSEPVRSMQNRDHYVFPSVSGQQPGPHLSPPAEPAGYIQPAGYSHDGLPAGTGSSRAGNERVQQAADASRQYLNDFLGILAKPHQNALNVSEAHLLHGVINMIAIAVLSALFFVIRLAPLHISFGTLFIKPLFLMALTLAAAGFLTAGLLKLTRVQSSWRLSVSQFGALLAPAAAALLLADLSVLLTLFGLSYILLLLAILFIILAVNVVLLAHPLSRLSIGRLDGLYSLFVVNAVTFYLIYTTLYSTLLSAVRALFGGFMSMF